MGVDLRTRRDGEELAVDPGRFFGSDLPRLAAERPDLVASAAHLDLRPLLVDVERAAWTLRREQGSVATRQNDPVPLRLTLTADQFSDLISDQITPVGMMTGATLDLEGGGIGRLLDWWLLLRSLLDGEPVYQPGSVELPDDLSRSFTLDDDPDETLAFLESAGFLHLRGVFRPEEMAAISADMDAAAPDYAPGDGNSWWATLDDGTERVVRMQRFEERSPTVAALLDDPRFRRIAGIARSGHEVGWASENRIEALFKPIGVASGISDIPWHKDCSLGRHSYDCCSLTVGISVTGAGPGSGQLRVIAGSHRARIWPSLLDTTQLDLPDVPLATDTGDVTVHLSCTLHMAEPPTERERRVLYTGFRLPALGDTAADRDARRKLLSRAREGAPVNTSQPAAR